MSKLTASDHPDHIDRLILLPDAHDPAQTRSTPHPIDSPGLALNWLPRACPQRTAPHNASTRYQLRRHKMRQTFKLSPPRSSASRATMLASATGTTMSAIGTTMLAISITLSMSACQQPSASGVRFTKQAVRGVAYDSVFSAARDAMRERFDIASENQNTGVIVARPKGAELPPDPTRPFSDKFNVKHQGRRTAEFRLRQSEEGVVLSCRVMLQRYNTSAVRAFELDRTTDDQPSATPAQRDAGSTPEQNAIWVNVHRDRDMERQILASTRELLNRNSSPKQLP